MGIQQLRCDLSAPRTYSVAIRNVTLSGQIISRGVALSIGTPPQNFALGLWPFLNNTYLFDNNYTIDGTNCNSQSTAVQCSVKHGGTFDEVSSSTWSQAAPIYVATETVNANTGDLFGTDTIQLGQSSNIPRYPIGIARNGEVSGDVLGLGSNSTFINTLLDATLIASRTWSVFWGQAGTNQHMDGLLTLGGYDAAKTSGSNFTDNLVNPLVSPLAGSSAVCRTGILVDVADITLDFLNGTRSSILGPTHGTSPYCIDPSQQDIWISPNASDLVQGYLGTAIGGTAGLHAGSMIYETSNAFSGNLTVSLTSGFSVTIPNDQLVVPDIYVESDGSLQEFSTSSRAVRLSPNLSTSTNELPLLGQLFLSSIYLMVNYETSQFTLWPINATTDTNFIAVNSSLPCASTTDPSPISSATHTPSASVTSRSISIGGIVGAAIGGAAFLTFIVFGLFLLVRARNANAHAVKHTGYVQEKLHDENGVGELDADRPTEIGEPLRHELQVPPRRYELDS